MRSSLFSILAGLLLITLLPSTYTQEASAAPTDDNSTLVNASNDISGIPPVNNASDNTTPMNNTTATPAALNNDTAYRHFEMNPSCICLGTSSASSLMVSQLSVPTDRAIDDQAVCWLARTEAVLRWAMMIAEPLAEPIGTLRWILHVSVWEHHRHRLSWLANSQCPRLRMSWGNSGSLLKGPSAAAK